MRVIARPLRIIAFMCAAAILLASASAAANKLVVVVANRILFTDLLNARLPTISKMISEGAVGLVSPNCAGIKSEFSTLLTASTGASCRGEPYVAECYDADEKTPGGEEASSSHWRRTGTRPHPGSAVFLGLAEAIRENNKLGSLAHVGALGDAVHSVGKRTCAIGNADSPSGTINRAHGVLAADSKGLIDVGMLQPARNCGLEVQRNLADEVYTAVSKADLIVINFGATTQLDDSKMSIADEPYAKLWASALRELDFLLASIINLDYGHRVTVVLISFSPPASPRWMELTPIVVYPSRCGGLLTSPTTKTPGLIAASDFAPTALNLLRINRIWPVCGFPAREEPSVKKAITLTKLSQRVTANRILELPMLWFFAAVGVFSYTLAACAVGFGILPRARRIIMIGILICAGAPLAMLVASPAPAGATGYAIGTALALVCIILTAWTLGRRDFRKAVIEGRPPARALPLSFIFWMTAGVIIVDSALGGSLCKFSLPSSYQISGYRYYGIGNEYAAVLISTIALAITLSGKTVREKAILVAGPIAVAFLGAGPLGANCGATFAAVICFGLFWQAVRYGGFRGRSVGFWCILGLTVAAAFVLADWKLAGTAGSHAGRLARAARTVGTAYVLDIAARKLLLNFRLICSNTSEKAFLAFVPFLALWFGTVQNKVRRTFESDNSTIAAFKALIIGAGAAFVANDSGVVTASIMLSMVLGAALYARLEEVSWEGS